MKRTVWLIIGLVLGTGGTWAYMNSVKVPKLIAENTAQIKEMIEAERILSEKATNFSGVVVSNDYETNTFVIETEVNGTQTKLSVTTDIDTMFYKLNSQANNPREITSPTLIAPGASVTFITNEAANGTTVYATEITAL